MVRSATRDHALAGPGGAAGHHVQPGDEFLDEKRLGQVIVGAEVEAFEAFVEFAAGGEKDHRHGHFPLAEIFAGCSVRRGRAA